MLSGVLAALGSAACFAGCSVAQHHAAGQLESHAALHPGLFLRLVRSRVWLLGGVANGAALGLQILALALAPVIVVQPLLVSGLLIAVPLSAAVRHHWPTGGEVVGALLCAGGLIGFLGLSHPRAGRTEVPIAAAAPYLAGCLIIVGAVVLLSHVIRSGVGRAVTLAAGSGLLFGFTGALLRLITLGFPGVLTSWPLYALLVIGPAGFLLSQNAFQAGTLPAPLAVLSILQPVVGVVVGIAMLHEGFEVGSYGVGPVIAAALVAVLGIVLICRDAEPATEGAEGPLVGVH